MSEFTGERVIPGLVDANLLNEHVARYRFAGSFVTEGARVLDAGCGSGYGSAELARKGLVAAIDISAEAIRHARNHFPDARVQFLQAGCESLPFADASFDLVASFEVIEHLPRWPELPGEAHRVLKSGGVFLVSTPNKAYYAESRAKAGPNPFHTHEFEYEEFRAALSAVFPHVRIWTQNHAEAIVFAPVNPTGMALDAQGDGSPELAHFFVAACSQYPLQRNDVFAWMPSTANVLREREHHIAKLEGELAKKDTWLRSLVEDHARLQTEHERTVTELKARAEWTDELNREVRERRDRIAALQEENRTRLEWVRRVEDNAAIEAESRLSWIHDLEGQIEAGVADINRLERFAETLQADLAVREEWGQSLNIKFHEKAREVQQLWEEVEELRALPAQLEEALHQLEQLREERLLVARSKWIRLGRKLKVGPVVDGV